MRSPAWTDPKRSILVVVEVILSVNTSCASSSKSRTHYARNLAYRNLLIQVEWVLVSPARSCMWQRSGQHGVLVFDYTHSFPNVARVPRRETRHGRRKSTLISDGRTSLLKAYYLLIFQTSLASVRLWIFAPSLESRLPTAGNRGDVKLKNLGKTSKKRLKGSVERSSLPWAIFLIFTRNRPWKSEDHLCTLFCIEMSKESLEKSERTPPVSWRPWARAYSRDRPYNFSCLSALSKNGRFRSFFLGFGVSFGEEEPFKTSNVSF